MKWEDYKQLNSEDREEWNFRFSKKPSIDISSTPIMIYIAAMSMVTVALISLETPIPESVVTQKELLGLLESGAKILGYVTTIALFEILWYIGNLAWRKNKEKKWLKNKIASKKP